MTKKKKATFHQLKRLVSTQAIDTFYQIHLTLTRPTIETLPSAISWLDPLLDTFSHLFSEPTSLRPSRTTDHTIPILNGANLVNVKPYRYPHLQKKKLNPKSNKCYRKASFNPAQVPFLLQFFWSERRMGLGVSA